MLQRSVVLILALLGALVPAAFSQSQDTPEEAAAPRPLKRFYFGGRLSVLGIPLVRAESFNQATSNPASRVENTASRTGSEYGGGPTVQWNVNRRFSITLDLLQHNAGYKSESFGTLGVDNPKTTTDERTYFKRSEITRADYWDVSALARIYYDRHARADFRRFFNFGAAYRRLTDIRTSRETTDTDGTTCCLETPATPAHRAVPGVVVGAGIQAIDDLGIKITPELRYTRWLRNSVDVTAVRSNKNQWEFVIGFTF
jgi:hypothetical protein